MSEPFFSVIIPTYNRAAKLVRALQSLHAQTFSNFEVIVCDDGSTDDTRAAVEAFRKQASFHLLYLYEANWGGPARPRNRGIAAAKGDWICFLDSDDSWEPQKLEAIQPYLNEYDHIYHDFYLVSENGHQRPLRARQLKPPVFNDLMVNGHSGCIINSGVCVRKKILNAVDGLQEDQALISVEDADLWLRIARITNRFKYVPLRLGHYYMEGDNITFYNEKTIEKLEYLFERHATYLKSETLVQQAMQTQAYHIGRIAQKMQHRQDAIRHYRSSLHSPNKNIALRSLYWLLRLHVRL